LVGEMLCFVTNRLFTLRRIINRRHERQKPYWL